MSYFSKYYQKDIVRLTKNLTPKGATITKVTHRDVNSYSKNLTQNIDYLLFNDALSYVDDIQTHLNRLKKRLNFESRIVVISFNFLWKPLLDLATNLGLREQITRQPNWLTPEDITNLFQLEGFETIKQGRRFLFPVNLGPVSDFINNFIAQLPIINIFCLTNYQVFRMAGQKKDYSVSIIIPARNEAGHLKDVLKKIPKLGKKTEVIFIEGHSKDNTYQVLKKEVSLFNQKVYQHLSAVSLYKQRGKGKGDAVRLGFKKANNEMLIILDADLTVDPKNLYKFYNVISKGQGEFVNGSRLVYPMETQAMQTLNYFGNKFFSLTFSYLLSQQVKDTLCGTKVLLKKDYNKIAQNRKYFGDFDPFGDFDLLFGATKLNLKLVEVPVRYKERVYGETNISRFTHAWLLLKMTIFAAKKLKFT